MFLQQEIWHGKFKFDKDGKVTAVFPRDICHDFGGTCDP